MNKTESALAMLEVWWKGIPDHPLGTLGGALVVLDRLQVQYILDIGAHTTKNGTQIAGQSGGRVSTILARFGESRRFLSEGGRTSRGGPRNVGQLLDLLSTLDLQELSVADRNTILSAMQKWLVERVTESFDRERIKFEFHPYESAHQNISELLGAARVVGREGQVAQYLVGAKLALRFPGHVVRNHSYSTSDAQLGEPGDFVLRDIVFHVTVAPNTGHFVKCQDNLGAGYRVYLLVPDRILLATVQNVGLALGEATAKRISVRSLETFVSQNLDELSIDKHEGPAGGFRELIQLYNSRVDSAESDKSLLIELPHNLLRDS
jgi:hypothetical protein